MLNTSIAHYKITAKLGQGGMGEVYRATDTKLGREVAIKVLPEAFASNKERLARFEREAKALARLNHPNVGSIYGFDQDNGQYFLVLELIEGDTLQERLRKGPTPVEDGLKIFQQIAEALEAAHEKNIVHRDLKPANIKIDPKGRVKVLDFGLAKARLDGTADSAEVDSMAPTITSEFTVPGKVMGTAAYMSPEQSRGHEVDKRTDVWAFGCCLYEALSGKKPFKGQTTSDLMAEILKSDPDFTIIPPETPSEVLSLLRRCLEKEPQRRLRDLGDIAITLEDVTETSRMQAAITTEQPSQRARRPDGGIAPWWRWLTFGSVVLTLVFAIVPLNRNTGNSQRRSVAVLPFANLTSEAAFDYTAAGLTEQISDGFMTTEQFEKVSPYRVTKGYIDSSLSNEELAEKLGVTSLIQGSLIQGGPHENVEVVTVRATLVDGESGKSVVIGAFPYAEDIPGQIVTATLNKLELSADADQLSQIESLGTTNAMAYASMRHGLDSFFRFTDENLSEATVEFEKARQLDPNYIDPLVWLASCKVVDFVNSPLTPGERSAEAQKILEKAAAMDPDNGAVLSLQGWIAMGNEWNWSRAKTAFRRAYQLHLNNPDYYDGMAWYKANIEGNYSEALEYLERIRRLDPDHTILATAERDMLAKFGIYERSLEQYVVLSDSDPNNSSYHYKLAIAHAGLGNMEKARQAAEAAVLNSNGKTETQLKLATILAQSGDRPGAESILREMETLAETRYVSSYFIAEVHAQLGRWDDAFRWLTEGYERKEGSDYMNLREHRMLTLMSDQARYWDLVEKMEFPALPFEHEFYEKEQEMRYGRTPASRSTAIDTSYSLSTGLDKKRIVVLPFEALGKKDDDLAFAESLTLAVRMQLDKVKELTVLDGSWLKVRSDDDVVTRYKELNAGTVLNGKVQQIGNQLVVNWELRDSQSPEFLSTGEEGTTTDDVFAGRGEIARSVARELKVELVPSEERDLNELPTNNLEAYKLYTQGRALWNRRTVPDFRKATDCFHQAIALDGDFALAYSGLADCHVVWPGYDSELPAEHLSLTLEFARKALELNPTLADPHATLGLANLVYLWDWRLAEREFQTAIRLNPDSANACQFYATFLEFTEQYPKAIDMAYKAVMLDPSPIRHSIYARTMIRSGQIVKGIAYLEQRIAVDPPFKNYHDNLLEAYLRQKRFDEASRQMTLLTSQFDGLDLLPLKARLNAAIGNDDEARRLLSQAEEHPEISISLGPEVALVYHLLGDDEMALDRLDVAVENRTDMSTFLPYRQDWKKLHDDPRYQAILRKLNLLK